MFFPSADFTSCLLFLFLAVSSSLRLCRPLWLRVSSACLCVSVSKCLSVLMSLWVSFSLHVFGYFFPFLGLAVSIYVSIFYLGFFLFCLPLFLSLTLCLSFFLGVFVALCLSLCFCLPFSLWPSPETLAQGHGRVGAAATGEHRESSQGWST